MDEAGRGWTGWWPLPAWGGLTALLIAVDGFDEPRSTGELVADSVETALIAAIAVAVAYVLFRQQLHHRERSELMRELSAARDEGAQWRASAREYVKGLGRAIDQQFAAWGLTPAEREVGLLLLKGLTHREIAHVRSTSERTVRQQSQAIYQKAGLSGRTALSAYFLEDLLPAASVEPDRAATATMRRRADEDPEVEAGRA